ncbi:MAG: FtsX-like permease family protein [Dehalococcoidia bacterium]|nr:FtsX-like permease family protein [Dehalococcoidia bacterium]
MNKLFGLPLAPLTGGLAIVMCLCVVVLTISSLRNRVMFKLASRNVPRRPAQTALILLGLMLAAMLFSASFTIGDTVSYSIRNMATDQLGQIDVMIHGQAVDAAGSQGYFDQQYAADLSQIIGDDSNVEGVAAAMNAGMPVISPTTELNEPNIELWGLDESWERHFDPIVDSRGERLIVADLQAGQAYLSSRAAEHLEVRMGDTVSVFTDGQPFPFAVAGIYSDGVPGDEISMVVPLAEAQSLLGRPEQVNLIAITNTGNAIHGATHTDEVMAILEPALEGTGLTAEAVKQEALDVATEAGDAFMSVFVIMAQFSVAAGVLLIFLTFVMLAAERKTELGTARALGTQHGHVIRMFTYEGAIYALAASAIGSILGLGIGWGMVRLMAAAFSQFDVQFSFHSRPGSLIIAYCLGVLLTLAVVAFSAWRVSKLNIIRAMKDIPEPQISRARDWKGLALAVLAIALGVLFTCAGFSSDSGTAYMVGVSLAIVGVCLLARRFGLPDRLAFSLAGIGLVAWWLLPPSLSGARDMTRGMEMFFLAGIMLVLGATFLAIHNMDLILKAVALVFGRVRGLSAVLKTAISYPMANRFRTGAALAMFCLVIFTLVVMSIINSSENSLYSDPRRLSGGFDISGTTSYVNPVADMNAAIQDAGSIDSDDIEAVGAISIIALKLRQTGTDTEYLTVPVQGIDDGYANSVSYGFNMMAEGYSSADEVWQAMAHQPGLAVVSSSFVARKVNYSLGSSAPYLLLDGFMQEDKVLPVVYVEEEATGGRLRVIGVLKDIAAYVPGIMTSQASLDSLARQPIVPTTYMFRIKDGADAKSISKGLETGLVQNGMDSVVIAEEVRDINKAGMMLNNLLLGFMGLGLIVGIAALGVIAARAVVERRKQIGALRAIGFQREAVQLAFLIESSFVALLGISLGVLLGYALSFSLMDTMSEQAPGVSLVVPWTRIAFIAAVAYLASLITTFLPARQASRVYPAEALRYE